MKNIPTAIYYPIPLHLQTAFKSLGYKHGDFPVSERCSERIFSIPMHPYLDENTQKEIVSTIKHT
jgi:dTDP-4-amino-4,6-dideoxygalactose transaminase